MLVLLYSIYYLLFIIYYLLFIIYYLLFIIYYLLFIIYYLLFIIYHLSFIIYHLSFIIYHLSFIIYHLLFIIYYLLFIIYYLLLITYYLLLITYYLLLITYYLLVFMSVADIFNRTSQRLPWEVLNHSESKARRLIGGVCFWDKERHQWPSSRSGRATVVCRRPLKPLSVYLSPSLTSCPKDACIIQDTLAPSFLFWWPSNCSGDSLDLSNNRTVSAPTTVHYSVGEMCLFWHWSYLNFWQHPLWRAYVQLICIDEVSRGSRRLPRVHKTTRVSSLFEGGVAMAEHS